MPLRRTSRRKKSVTHRRKKSSRKKRKSSRRRKSRKRRKSSRRKRRKSSRKRRKSSRKRRKSSRKRRKSSRKRGNVAIKTDPALWEESKRAACTQGGLCEHSARKMQWAVRYYKQHGGGYRGSKANNSLRRWGREKWRTSSGKKSEGKRRYLPEEKWKRLSRKQIQRTNAAKARGYRQGKQYVSQPEDIKKKIWGGAACPYTITNYTKQRAKRLGVTVRKSSNPNKKIDVFKNGKKVSTVGGCGYKDYPTFLREDGKDVANRKRRGFKSRFQRHRTKRGSKAYYADQLLW